MEEVLKEIMQFREGLEGKSVKVDGAPADEPNRALTVMTLEDTVMRNLDLEED